MIHVLFIYFSKKCMFDADTKLNIELKHDSPEKFGMAPSDLLIKLKEGSQWAQKLLQRLYYTTT